VLSAPRSDETVDLEPMPTEIALQIPPVRNVLAFFEGDTQEVRLEGGRSLVNQVEELRKAASVYEQKAGETLIKVSEEDSAGGYAYRFGFLYEGSYYEIIPVGSEPS